MKNLDSLSDKLVVVISYVVLTIISIAMLYPFWELVVISISSRADSLKDGLHFFVTNPDFTAYRDVLSSQEIWRGFYNSTVRVVIGTAISVSLTALTAYPLSKNSLPFNKQITALVLFTMIFSGGLIPGYLLMRSLHMVNTIWVLVIPNAVGAYNLIIVRNFLKSIPESLEESAELDGAGKFTIWLRIVMPLSLPVLATVALWVAVGHWNAYFDALIYINDRSKYVLQIVLRRILLESQVDMFIGQSSELAGMTVKPTEETTKAAVIIISTIPITLIYPFLQKHFSKGIMLGAVKG